MNVKIETLVGAFMLIALALLGYMSFQLGSVRLNLARYASYSVSFNDVSNLLPKADIKIAGVKVGWVDSVFLDPQDMKVKVYIKVLKEYKLYGDAQAHVRQEGLLGVKFLELAPGTSDAELVLPGKHLPFQARKTVGVDEILISLTTLAKQIERLGTSLEESNQEARILMKSIQERVNRLDSFFSTLESASSSFQETAAAVKKVTQQVSNFLPSENQKDKKKSIISTLLAEDQVYEDIKSTSDFARTCVDKVKKWKVGFDTHSEVLPSSDCISFVRTQVKWYGDAYFGSEGPWFAKLGLTYSSEVHARRSQILQNGACTTLVLNKRDPLTLNLQVGTYWHPYCALRLGIFEGTAGIGLDWWFAYNHFRWLSTFEVFDFQGNRRVTHECTPHLKWLNRIFLSEHLYATFGIDDISSATRRRGFIGVGAYFALPSFSACL